MDKKNLVINRYTVWTIPNMLVFLRILCVPVYMTLIILGAKAEYPDWWVFLALGIMAFAASTDVFDGMIARKYTAGTKIGKYTVKHDQGTYVGQVIDPIADKTMHIGALVALIVAGYLHWIFIVFLVFRELVMIVCGSLFMNKINVKSNKIGKVASAILSVGIIACFFHAYIRNWWGEYGIDWILVTIGLVLNWISGFNYLAYAVRELRKYKHRNESLEEQPQAIPSSYEKENAEQ